MIPEFLAGVQARNEARRGSTLLYSSCLLALVAAPAATRAQEVAALEEVVVTAERRQASLQDSPVSVSVLSGNFLQDVRVDNPSSLSAHIPNLGFANFNRVQAIPSLRGAQTFDDSPGVEVPVAVFIDDVYYGRVTDWDLAFFDIERVEILKGPQGALYGRNVTGGVVKVVTQKPEQEFDAKAELSAGNLNNRDARFVLNGALGSRVSGRLAALYQERDGYSRNPRTGNELDAIDKLSLRGQLLIDVSDAVTARLQAGFTRDESFGQSRDFIGSPITAPDLSIVPTDNNPDTAFNGYEGGIDREAWNASATVDADLGAATLSSITAYFNDDTSLALTDIAAAPVPMLWESNAFTVKQFTQEFRVLSAADSSSPLSWLGGVYYLKTEHERDRDFYHQLHEGTMLGDLQQAIFGNNDVQYNLTSMSIETESYSAYAQATYAFTDQLNLTAGGRYTRDEKRGHLSNDVTSFIFMGPGPFSNLPLAASWNEFTPKVTLDYKVAPDILTYVTWAQGFKSGGFTAFNPDAVSVAQFQQAFDPERATNIEAGAKTRWLQDRLQVNFDIYQVDYKDLQVAVNNADGSFTVTNAGEAKAHGADIEVLARPVPGLDLWINYSWFDGEFDRGPFDGSRMPSPQNAYTAGASYAHDIGSGTLRLHADVQYKQLYPQEPGGDTSKIGLDNIFNAGIAWALNEHWEFELWGRNLSDERSANYINDFSAFYYSEAELGAGSVGQTINYVEPRTWGLTARYRVR